MNLVFRLLPFFFAFAWSTLGCSGDDMRNRPFPDAEFDQPPQLPPQPHREATATGKEIVTAEFIMTAPAVGSEFTPELPVLSLDKSWSGGEVYMNIESVGGNTVINPGFFEIATTTYAAAGNARSVINRAAYRCTNYNGFASGITLPFVKDLYLGLIRHGAERYDVGVRFAGRDGSIAAPIGVIRGTLSAVGYADAGGAKNPTRVFATPDDAATNLALFVRRPVDLYRIRATLTDPTTPPSFLYLQLFDSNSIAAIPAGSVALRSYPIIPGGSIDIEYPDPPLRFNEGIRWAISSTSLNLTASARTAVVQLDYA